MAYGQWIAIKNRSNLPRNDIRIKNAEIIRGKFYQKNKDTEIYASDVNNLVIPPNSEVKVEACGRASASEGTEGSYKLYEWDGTQETFICRVYWSAPWGNYYNVFSILDYDPNTSSYTVEADEVQQDSTIGNIGLSVAKLA